MKTGFTLIELLVVVAIIGILIALAFPVISQVRDSAKTAAARMDMQSIITGTEEYAAEYRRLPLPDPFLGNDGPQMRRWDATKYGWGWVEHEVKGLYNGQYERLGIGWVGRLKVEDPNERKLLRLFIATLQGSNRFDLNPRKAEYLQKQEGRPTGLYMDPWSKGLTLEAHPENRQYNLLIDHNMNGIIEWAAVWDSADHLVKNRLVVARCHGPNRVANNDMAADNFDDIFSINVDKFIDIANENN